MLSKKIATGLLAALLTLATGAHAGVVFSSGSSGAGDVVIDPTTGDEWLRLDVTTGMSTSTATADFASYGFAVASTADLNTLLDDFFTTYGGDNGVRAGSGGNGVAVSSDVASDWNALFGLTYNANGMTESLGWYDSGWFGWNNDPATFNVAGASVATFDIGVFMVRAGDPSNVPEPASLALVGLGLFGMAAVRRQRKN